MVKKLMSVVAIMIVVLFAGCEKKPVNRLINPTTSNTTGSITWTAPWIIYDDEIKTGGGIARFTTAEGQELDFSSRQDPHSGNTCIKFSWDGSVVTPYGSTTPEYTWIGFSFKVQNDNNANSPTTKDLTPGHYTKVSFYARGTLSSNVRLRVVGTGNATEKDFTVTSVWQQFTAPVGNLSAVDSFSGFFLVSADGARSNGGTVFLDDIQLIQ